MGDWRKPVEVLERRLPQNRGKKSPNFYRITIELFPAKLWKSRWKWYDSHKSLFYPRVPLKIDKREAYMKNRYRVRLNGTWVMEKATFQMFTREQAIKCFLIKEVKVGR